MHEYIERGSRITEFPITEGAFGPVTGKAVPHSTLDGNIAGCYACDDATGMSDTPPTCSANTVSLALRDSHRISPEMRERIKNLAAEKGYRPNPLVSALISSRRQAVPTQTLAVITKFDYALFTNVRRAPHFCVQLLEGLRQKADELGFRLELFPVLLPDAPDGKKLTRILLARGIRGVLLFPSGNFATAFPELDWKQFAVVAAGFHSKHLPLHRTATDHGRSVETSIAKLQERGIRRIALAATRQLDPRWNYSASGRYFSWQALQPKSHRIPVIPEDTEHPSEEGFVDWILRYRPEALIAHYDYYVDRLKRIAQTHDFHVLPVLYNDSERKDCCRVDPQTLHLGRTSVGVLARELFLNHFGLPKIPEVTFVGGAWVEAEVESKSPALLRLQK